MTEQNKKPNVSLASLLTPSKTVSIDFPGMEGFTVDVCYLAREELIKLRNKSVTQKFNKKTRSFEEQLDENKFLVEYTKSIIKGWKGLKYSYLEELLLVDISSLDPEDELVYNQDNAETLMKNASDFDSWINETTGDLENFTKTK
jgi:predicted RNA-binding protein with EMAP domain